MLSELEKNILRDHYRLLAHNLPNFRPRAAQREMLAAIARTFAQCREPFDTETEISSPNPPPDNGRHIIAIEGPTGVGKSLAYLLAGIVMAQSRKKTFIVSTATIALQEQLVFRDLPMLIEYSQLDATYAIAKGRGRYLCPENLHRLIQTPQQSTFDFDLAQQGVWERKPLKSELEQLENISNTFKNRTWNGDRDDYPEKIPDELWVRITNDQYGCTKEKCTYFEVCPFFLARKVLQTVDVIVTNHDLLLADSVVRQLGGAILPPPNTSLYCIDEAHHLSHKAIDHFAQSQSYQRSIEQLKYSQTLFKHIRQIINRDELIATTEDICKHIELELKQLKNIIDRDGNWNEHLKTEQTWVFERGEIDGYLSIPFNNLKELSANLVRNLKQCQHAFEEFINQNKSEEKIYETPAVQLKRLKAHFEAFESLWRMMQNTPSEPYPPIAKWIQRKKVKHHAKKNNYGFDYEFNASPVSAAQSLRHTLWYEVSGALLTSATLRSLGSFNLLMQQTGLKHIEEVQNLALHSPFNFNDQGELYIPPLKHSPKDADAHTQEIIELLPTLIDLNEAVGTLVLFSSKKQMLNVAESLPETFKNYLKIQHETPKNILLSKHREQLNQNQPSIIFGLDSFAEGLDLPGYLCVHVIIAKLPFSAPDNPVSLTLEEWIKSRGGNYFMEVTIPEASIKLIQAVGRLIRSENDYGRVTILDNRLKTHAYGKQLLAALPPFRRI